MGEALEVQVKQLIEERELIGPGDLVLAGVSGGADSMCLARVLLHLSKELGFSLRIIHVEHGIRGADSLEDARFVEDYCKDQELPCQVVQVDARAYAKEKGCSLEEAARILRFQAFEREADAWEEAAGRNAQVKIALAHHREDQAETMLWQLIRGSDLRGLGGIRPSRDRYVRPLLDVTREQIETYLRAHGTCWREDVTNQDRSYTRNRLRLEVLPVLTQLNTQAIRHLCDSAALLQETEDYLERQTDAVYEQHVGLLPDGELLIGDGLQQEEPLLQRRVLYRALSHCAQASKDLQARHIAALMDLFSHQVGHSLTLPYEVRARRDYEGIRLAKNRKIESEEKNSQSRVYMEILDYEPGVEISKKKYTKCFDYDKIKHHVQIRKRQSGDYLTIDGEGHVQKLKSYLINEKIPAPQRDQLLLLADGSHILWVIGYRISDYYKVDAHTKRILKVQYRGGKEDE